MKKLIVLFLSLVIVATSARAAFTVSAASEVSGIYTYTLTNGEVTITDVNSSVTGEVEIPSTIKDCPVTAIGYEAFYLSNVTGVTIPEGVKSIGASAFYYCDEMTYINLPQSLETIGDSAFYNCKKLKTVTLPSNLKKISHRSFRDCYALESINIPSGITEIPQEAFHGCSSLKSIKIPSSVESIGYEAFFFCSNLAEVELAEGLKNIGSMAFGWTEIKSLHIPASVTKIDSSPVLACDNLKSLTVASGNSTYYSSNNCVVETRTQTMITSAALSEIIVPNGVKIIGGIMNADTVVIESLIIPKSVERIYSYVLGGISESATVYYTGSADDWTKITIDMGNERLLNANIVYNHVMPYTPGDVNDNGQVTLDDVVVLAQKVAGWSVSCNESALNVNGVGIVNLDDVVHLAQYVAGWNVIVH